MLKRLVFTAAVLVAAAGCVDRPGITAPDDVLAGVSAAPAAAGATLIEVKFNEELGVRPGAGNVLRSTRGRSLDALQRALDRVGATGVRPLVEISEGELATLVAEGRRYTPGEPVPDMGSWYQMWLPPGQDPERALAELRALPEVEHAYLAPTPALAPTAPDFSAYQQSYFGPAPQGTEAIYARSQPGGRGTGVVLVDIEYDWTFSHEDLGLFSSILITGGRYTLHGTNHGTAVLGVLVGRDNGYGVTGGAPDATIRVAGTQYSGAYKPASAITNAAAQMVAGDVMLLELQARGPSSDTSYIPLEWITSVYDAIRTATAKGIIVIEPAGNGGRNLDASLYGNRFNRTWYNSRAIVVGAGDAYNARMSFSSYGSRVDVQGRGTSVTTTGYGDLFGTTLNDYYTPYFGGTSSASAIVAAAATTIQGYQKYRSRPVQSPSALAYLFRSTGSAQGGNTAQNIGPQPNLRAAMVRLDAPSSPPPLSVAINGPAYIPPYTTCTWTAAATGGTGPYYTLYDWWMSGAVMDWWAGEVYMSGSGSVGSVGVSVTVTDAAGQTASAYLPVEVSWEAPGCPS